MLGIFLFWNLSIKICLKSLLSWFRDSFYAQKTYSRGRSGYLIQSRPYASRLHREVFRTAKHLQWSVLEIQSTAFRCQLFSQKTSPQMFDTVVNTSMRYYQVVFHHAEILPCFSINREDFDCMFLSCYVRVSE